MDEDETCPVCKMNRYLNPSMKIYVSPCCHKMCETCIERRYAQGSGPCPICGSILRKTQFSIPKFEDLLVEKEIRIRKRLYDIFYKTETDFSSLKEYNDYLENLEDQIFHLVNEPDWQKAEDIIENLRKENNENIKKNQQRLEKENKEIEYSIESYQKAKLLQRARDHQLILEEAEEKERSKRDLTNSKPASRRSSSKVISSYSQPAEFINEFKKTSNVDDVMEIVEELPFVFDPLETCHKEPVHIELTDNYFDPIYQSCNAMLLKGGGYKQSLYQLYCIQSSYASLYEWL